MDSSVWQPGFVTMTPELTMTSAQPYFIDKKMSDGKAVKWREFFLSLHSFFNNFEAIWVVCDMKNQFNKLAPWAVTWLKFCAGTWVCDMWPTNWFKWSRGTWHAKPYLTLGGWGQVSGPKKNLDPQTFWPFAATDTTASWNNNWKPKKMRKCKFCAISHLIWPTQSKPVKPWTFLGEIVVNLIPLNHFHSESRLHIGALKTWKS